MSDTKMKELQQDITELKTLLSQASRKRVQDILSLEIRKLETEWVALKEAQQPMDLSPTPATTSQPSESKRYQVKVNGYGWDQSDKYVKVFVTLKDVQKVPKENVFCTLTERSMELHILDLEGKDYLLIINKLLEPINVEDSHWKQKTDMVVIFLAKSRQNFKWTHITEIDKKLEEQRNNRFKNDDAEKKDPQESIMGLMKNMYETGDDDMKRMISKAWYEGQHKKRTDTIDDLNL